jgi:hypothetical protein
MTRWKAAAIHLGISICIGSCAAALIFGVWYPSPYSHAVGADELIVLLLGVDVVLGPLLTLVVFKSGKPSLRFDLAVIAIVQTVAFTYGMSVVVRARPVFIVGRADRFVIVSANDLDSDDLDKAADPKFRSMPWTGPKLIGAAPPKTVQERNDLLFSSIGGKDLEKFPQYYVDYADVAPSLLKFAKPLDDLKKSKPRAWPLIDAYLSAHRLQSNEFVWLPIDARRASMTMLMDRATGRPIRAFAVDPW